MKKTYLIIISLFLLNSCSGRQTIEPTQHIVDPIQQPTEQIDIKYNFVFTAVNNFIDRPERDGRVFYRIFINKEEYGRTTTGLESQVKIYETNLSEKRHLLNVEKWVLNNSGEYVRANNILQPTPDFVYFNIIPNRITSVTLQVNNRGRYEFLVEEGHL